MDLNKKVITDDKLAYYDYYIDLLKEEQKECERQIESETYQSHLQAIELKKRSLELLREIDIKTSIRNRIADKLKRDKERYKELEKDFKKQGQQLINAARKYSETLTNDQNKARISTIIDGIEKAENKEQKLNAYHHLKMVLDNKNS